MLDTSKIRKIGLELPSVVESLEKSVEEYTKKIKI
jgi:hypothetical protein